VKVAEINQADDAVQQFSRDLMERAESENLARNFALSMQAQRNPVVVPYVTPAVPPQIAENTRLEMEAGRKRVAEFEALEAARPKRAPDPTQGGSVAVFRPGDYVPDQKQGQGLVAGNSARPL
jgi:hypothetical protein